MALETHSKSPKFYQISEKLADKVYYRTTEYPGGIRTTKLSDLMDKKPSEALRRMVYNMLPDNKLRPKMIKRLIIK